MKKTLSLLLCLIAISAVALSACVSKQTVVLSDNNVVIQVEEKDLQGDNTTLETFMIALKEKGDLKFNIENGMVTEINGVKNTTNSFWMLYTDDSENSNSAWGIVKYDGKDFGSATLGAAQLPIKAGCKYIWNYQTF